MIEAAQVPVKASESGPSEFYTADFVFEVIPKDEPARSGASPASFAMLPYCSRLRSRRGAGSKGSPSAIPERLEPFRFILGKPRDLRKLVKGLGEMRPRFFPAAQSPKALADFFVDEAVVRLTFDVPKPRERFLDPPKRPQAPGDAPLRNAGGFGLTLRKPCFEGSLKGHEGFRNRPAEWWVHPMLLRSEAVQRRALGSADSEANSSAFWFQARDSASSETIAIMCAASMARASCPLRRAPAHASRKCCRASWGCRWSSQPAPLDLDPRARRRLRWEKFEASSRTERASSSLL